MPLSKRIFLQIRGRDPRWLQKSLKLCPLAPRPGPLLQLNHRAINLKIQLSVREGVSVFTDECVDVCASIQVPADLGGTLGRVAQVLLAEPRVSGCADLEQDSI